jgi:hypothetical protein
MYKYNETKRAFFLKVGREKRPVYTIIKELEEEGYVIPTQKTFYYWFKNKERYVK